MKSYLGIDPGATGALALILPTYETIIHDYANDPIKAVCWLEDMILTHGQPRIALEKVHAVQGQGISSTFKFGLNTGIIKGMLFALGLPFIEVTPQRWQAFSQVPKKANPNDKPSLQVVKQLFPLAGITLKKHHGRADALLLAYYAKQNNL
jgi:crossover junction endodeoxyribonuclease RuvC